MPGFVFKRSTGAEGDRKELEYVIALHQTCLPDTRENATVSSSDIAALLLSRYSLRITHDEALNVVRSLGAGDTRVLGHGGSTRLNSLTTSPKKGRGSDHGIFRTGQPSPRSKLKSTTNPAMSSSDEAIQDERKRHDGSSSDQNVFFSCVERPDDDPENNNKRVHFNSLIEPSTNNETGAAQGEEEQEQQQQQQYDEYLDLVQILSVILMPTIARAADEDRNGPEPHKTFPVPADNANIFIRKVYYPFMSMIQELGNAHYEKQRPKPKGKTFFDHAIAVLLKDVILPSNSSDDGQDEVGTPSPLLTEELVRELLLLHGEVERAENSPLIREMVHAAQSSSGRLDREALIHAMSSDLSEYKIGSEDKVSTFFADVFGEADPRNITSLYQERSANSVKNDDEEVMEIIADNTETTSTQNGRVVASGGIFASERTSIDMVLDSHSSIWTHVLIFLSFLLNVIVYGTQIIPDYSSRDCKASDFGCTLGITVYSWLILALVLSAFGMLYILPLSVGNNPFRRTSLHAMFSFIISVAYTIIPFALLNWKTYDGINQNFLQQFKFLQLLTLASGLALSLSLALHIIVPFVVKLVGCIKCVPSLFTYLTTSSNVRGEAFVKWAATRKVNTLLVNADGLHALSTDSQNRRTLLMKKNTKKALRKVTDETMRNYVLNSAQRETIGGGFWTWQRIFNGRLFTEEGIWINSRLIVFQVCMVVAAIAFAYLLIWSVREGAEAADNARASLDPSTVPAWVDDLIPTGEMVRRSLYPSAAIGIIVSFILTTLYIPSMVSTALQYRSQERPSLGSPYFNKYRNSTQNVYMNTANAVYGMVGSAGLFYLVIGLLVFLFLWPPTKDVAMLLLAWCLGLTITVVLKMILTTFCRSKQYRSFYRIRPRAARLSSLALECWFVGLGGSVLIGRVCQFLFAAVFWVGRIDAPFLDEDVSLIGYSFDYVPTYFVQDILIHEAHRHPYIERLSQMYLMKLLHRDRFVSHAGAAWRQLFVVSFFPWLARYRVFQDERYAEAMEDLDERQKEEQEAEKHTNVAVGKAGLRLVLETVDDVIGVSTDSGEQHEDGGCGRNHVDPERASI